MQRKWPFFKVPYSLVKKKKKSWSQVQGGRAFKVLFPHWIAKMHTTMNWKHVREKICDNTGIIATWLTKGWNWIENVCSVKRTGATWKTKGRVPGFITAVFDAKRCESMWFKLICRTKTTLIGGIAQSAMKIYEWKLSAMMSCKKILGEREFGHYLPLVNLVSSLFLPKNYNP